MFSLTFKNRGASSDCTRTTPLLFHCAAIEISLSTVTSGSQKRLRETYSYVSIELSTHCSYDSVSDILPQEANGIIMEITYVCV